MGPNEDLPTLIQRKDHLEVLRYLRAHQLRQPELAIEHGKALLGDHLTKSPTNESSRLAVLEQICLAALDVADHDLAEVCMKRLGLVIGNESVRFRRLLGRCLEASGDLEGAERIYDALLNDNPANLVALQRKYCIERARSKDAAVIASALNDYLAQNMSDVSAWYEMATLRKSLGDFKGAAYALEQVTLGNPLEASIHVELAEAYATYGGLEELSLARKHMAQALELDASNRRAMFGLISTSNQFLELSRGSSKKKMDDVTAEEAEHSQLVAKELIKYGAEKLTKAYKGTDLFAAVQAVLQDYTDNDS